MVAELVENSVIIHRDELQILLNIFGNKIIDIDYPLFNLKLIQANTSGDGYRLHLLSDEEDFQGKWDDCTCKKEMPTFNDIKECMLLSGIIQYDNLDDFKKKVKSLDLIKKTVYFALDTNMFYHGFPSQANYIQFPHYLVVDTVYDEIESSVNYKYKPNQINEMKKCAPYNAKLLGNLGNQKMKKSRKAAYVGMKEYNHIIDTVREFKSEVPSTTDSEENDRIIVNAIRKFEAENNNAYTIFLTADTNASNLCEGKGPDYFYFRYPSNIDAKECTSNQLVNLIYWFAIANGFIKCNSVIIFGEFGHKGRDDESLKLLFYNRELFDTFTRELKICRRLMELEIAR